MIQVTMCCIIVIVQVSMECEFVIDDCVYFEVCYDDN